MTDSMMNEKLSQLLDDELNASDGVDLLSRIAGDVEAQTQWRRYSLMRESLRSGRVLVPDAHFAERISAAVADEPTVLAPRRATRKLPEKAVTVALAASLAMVAVLVAKSLQDYTPGRGADLLALSDLMGSTVQSTGDAEFRDYLVSHYETAYLSGAQGMLPSVQLVSADAGR